MRVLKNVVFYAALCFVTIGLYSHVSLARTPPMPSFAGNAAISSVSGCAQDAAVEFGSPEWVPSLKQFAVSEVILNGVSSECGSRVVHVSLFDRSGQVVSSGSATLTALRSVVSVPSVAVNVVDRVSFTVSD